VEPVLFGEIMIAFLLFLKTNIKWVIIGVMALMVAFFVWSWGSRGTEIAELNAKLEKAELINKTLAANIGIEKMNQELQESATAAVERRLVERNKQLDELCKVWNKIDEKDTDPVGTVLDALRTDGVQ
jgi:biopolymer transport protein ExbB/TolQ